MAQGRVYSLGGQQAAEQQEEHTVAQGMFLIHNTWASVLVDTGASFSFISAAFSRVLGLSVELLESPLCVETPVGAIAVLRRVCRDCEVRVADFTFLGDLIVLDMTSFDVIIGMDWLAKYRASIDCFRRALIASGAGSQ